MFKFKRFSISVIAMVLLINTLAFSASAFAEENKPNLTEEAQTQELISTLEQYVSADDNQFEVNSIPAAVYSEFGSENVNSILEGIDYINELAQDEEVIITENGTVYEADDTSFDVQGGVNKIVWTWYGRKSYMGTSRANSFVQTAKNVSYGSAAVGAVAAYFSFGTSALFGGLTSLYFAKLADDVTARNSGHSRGIIVHMTFAAAYWTERQ